jgi:hypothetical protein
MLREPFLSRLMTTAPCGIADCWGARPYRGLGTFAVQTMAMIIVVNVSAGTLERRFGDFMVNVDTGPKFLVP